MALSPFSLSLGILKPSCLHLLLYLWRLVCSSKSMLWVETLQTKYVIKSLVPMSCSSLYKLWDVSLQWWIEKRLSVSIGNCIFFVNTNFGEHPKLFYFWRFGKLMKCWLQPSLGKSWISCLPWHLYSYLYWCILNFLQFLVHSAMTDVGWLIS